MQVYLLLATLLCATSVLGCDLKVESAWIREAPPGASTLAAYARLRNGGDKTIYVLNAHSDAFTKIELHESITVSGMVNMRAIDKLEIAPGMSVEFAPGGKHFMLFNPKSGLKDGDVVNIVITDSNNCKTDASFKVTRAASKATRDAPHMSRD